jgi:hypothetical protein
MSGNLRFLVCVSRMRCSASMPPAECEAFRLAHRDAGQNKPLYLDHPQFEGFEVRQAVRRGDGRVAGISRRMKSVN